MSKHVLAFFHYALFAAVPVFLILVFDGQLWPSIVPTFSVADPLGIPIAIAISFLMASLFIAMIRLALDASYRESCLASLAGIDARDEREALIVGKAARATLLLSLAATIGLCVAGLFLVERDNVKGQTSFLIAQNRAQLVHGLGHTESAVVVEVMPLTKTGVLVFMFALQLGAFRYFSMRAAKR